MTFKYHLGKKKKRINYWFDLEDCCYFLGLWDGTVSCGEIMTYAFHVIENNTKDFVEINSFELKRLAEKIFDYVLNELRDFGFGIAY